MAYKDLHDLASPLFHTHFFFCDNNLLTAIQSTGFAAHQTFWEQICPWTISSVSSVWSHITNPLKVLKVILKGQYFTKGVPYHPI